jgi:hypothetical protein
MLRISKDELMSFNPCDPESRVVLFERRKYLDVKIALNAGVSIHDILWVVGKLGRKDLCVKFALACAVRVEALDKTGAAKRCNEAVGKYVANPSPETAAWSARSAAQSAAWSAAWSDAAQSAAWSARSAAQSADAARSAWSARSAAWLARSAARSADAAQSADAEEQAQKQIMLDIFK